MESQHLIERPYRSHLRPACLQCKRRKSRCKIEAHSPACLMCRVHGTSCTFPPQKVTSRGRACKAGPTAATSSSTNSASQQQAQQQLQQEVEREPPATPIVSPWSSTGLGPPGTRAVTSTPTDSVGPATTTTTTTTPLSGDDEDQENPHIVGPANTNDSQVLTDYLSIVGSSSTRMRMVHPVRLSTSLSSRPVLFAAVKKRPVGVQVYSNHAREKLHIIEQLLSPHAQDAVDFFLGKINTRLPLLDPDSFLYQYQHAKDKISPALLACLYAHTLTYWQSASGHFRHHKPDGRFIWNLANDALYTELHLSPGISTITAILLNVGGRPTTSLIGNGVQLGAALSLAHSLGLNRNPLSWDLPSSEKLLRAKTWWCLEIHDKWSSLAHGTPPHIQRSQHDVPPPEPHHFLLPTEPPETREHEPDATAVFIALYGLTEVLGECLHSLYDLRPQSHKQQQQQQGPGLFIQVADSSLEFRLNSWVESLKGPVRGVILRGHNLSRLPGAANLRLAYFATLLLLRRMELEASREQQAHNLGAAHHSMTTTGTTMAGTTTADLLNNNTTAGDLANKYLRAQQTAEEIVLLVSELGREQLDDFWLPGAAFVLSSAETFLLRCAVEGGGGGDADIRKSSALRIAWDLIVALRRHRDEAGWDLGDICLAQYEEVVRRLVMAPSLASASAEHHGRQEGGEARRAGEVVSLPVPELQEQIQDLDWMAQLFPDQQWVAEMV